MDLAPKNRPDWLTFAKALTGKLLPLLSCFAFTAISVIAALLNSNRAVLICSGIAALVFYFVSAFLAWQAEYNSRLELEAKLNSKHAEFVLQVTQCITYIQPEPDRTLLLFAAQVVNRGNLSTVTGWRASIKFPTSTEQGQFIWLRKPLKAQVGTDALIITNEGLLPVRAGQKAIGQGELVSGRMVVRVPGVHNEDVSKFNFTVDFEIADYLGKTFQASYQPGSNGVKSPLLYATIDEIDASSGRI